MNRSNGLLWATISIAMLILIFFIVTQLPTLQWFSLQKNFEKKSIFPRFVEPRDHIRGNRGSDIAVIEYADTECPYCKEAHKALTGIYKLRSENFLWVYRHLPIESVHTKSLGEAVALECAAENNGDEAFWRFVDYLFLITPSNDNLAPEALPQIAQAIGIDVSAFEQCRKENRYTERIRVDLNEAFNLGAQGTPFIALWNKSNGKIEYINYAPTIAQLKEAIERVE
ncbi:MAG: thioredoxin domain-containing protein [Parcubacteria group bacterium]|nr:thioredoxin domain-containing protein [Parcubacteria group bacterium]